MSAPTITTNSHFGNAANELPQCVASESTSVLIKPASTLPELMAIYRFRYKIYHEEMQRRQDYADHFRKTISDPLDACAMNFAAWEKDRIVGVVRANLARDMCLAGYEDLYQMHSFGEAHPAHTAIVTRMMVEPQKRGSRLAVDLAAACYRFGLAHAIKFNFIDCNAHLVRFFKGIGYRDYIGTRMHDEYGEVTPMVFHLDDHQHLQEIRSPLYSVIRGAEVPGTI